VLVQYKYRNFYTQHLPHKLAEFIGNNYAAELGIHKAGSVFTVAELNGILRDHIVSDRLGKQLHTFGAIEWEHEDFEGRPRAKCRQFMGGKEELVSCYAMEIVQILVCVLHYKYIGDIIRYRIYVTVNDTISYNICI
jgi:hypothetical protein